MKDEKEIEEACERAAKLNDYAEEHGSRWRAMTYEQGLREALDWVLDNIEEDPTKTK